MAFMGPAQGGTGLQLAGKRTSGLDVRTQNVTAVTAVANIVKTSLGPVGLDKVQKEHTRVLCIHLQCWNVQITGTKGVGSGKQHASAVVASSTPSDMHTTQMLVDDIGDVTITNDGATILKLLEVEHPAARVRGQMIMMSCVDRVFFLHMHI